jgi:hypothetical protein
VPRVDVRTGVHGERERSLLFLFGDGEEEKGSMERALPIQSLARLVHGKGESSRARARLCT